MIMWLRRELTTIKKWTSSITSYLSHISVLAGHACKIAKSGKPMEDNDLEVCLQATFTQAFLSIKQDSQESNLELQTEIFFS